MAEQDENKQNENGAAVESAAEAVAPSASAQEAAAAEAVAIESSGSASKSVEDAETESDTAEASVEKEAASLHGAEEDPKPAAGAPVEEESPTETEVLRAVSRAGDVDTAVPGPKRQGGAVAPENREVTLAEMPLIDDDLLAAAAGKGAAESAQDAVQTVSPEAVKAPGLANPIAAAFYTEVPEQPELRGNRGAGFLISLLATLAYAVVLAGVICIWLAPQFTASEFLQEGLLPQVLSVHFLTSVIAFFVGLLLIVLICGKAGWWAYVLGGFPVAVLVWFANLGGQFVQDRFIDGKRIVHSIPEIFDHYGLSILAVMAALVAREVVVWFGAWIGARGRRIKLENRAAIAEYETAVAAAEGQSSTVVDPVEQRS